MRMMDYFEQGWQRGPHRPAFIDGDAVTSWDELRTSAYAIAAGLHASPLSDQGRIGILSPNDPRAFAVIIGIFRAGQVWVPINGRNTAEANTHLLKVTECGCLFYHSSFEEAAFALKASLAAPQMLVCLDREGAQGVPSLDGFIAAAAGVALPEVPDDNDRISILMATGGTTSLSKAAPWTQLICETLISSYWHCLPGDEPPVHLVAGPMTHAAGALALMMMNGGPTNVILRKADPLAIMRSIEAHRITHMHMPPTLLYMVLAHPEVRNFDYSSLKYLVIGGSAVAPEKLREAVEVFGPVVCECFGQAEAPMWLTFLSSKEMIADLPGRPDGRWASCGRPVMSNRVEIMADDGTILPRNQRGEIVARGNLVIKGYFNNADASRTLKADGWLRTGDVGYIDDDGFVYIVDRKKEMIVTGGFNVFAAEIEQVILSMPEVRECAVIGVPDPKWGEAVKAIVELKQGQQLAADAVAGLVRRQLGGVHTPKSVEFWEELPRSVNGKVLKRDIRERYWQGRDRAV